jgi:hypothetical protein
VIKFAAPLALLAGLSGCVVAADTTNDTQDLSATSRSYITLRLDTRKCQSPMCGGYFIRDANKTTAERYVYGLDFTGSGLSDADIETVKSTPPEELVLRGKLGAYKGLTRPFVVSEAYVGMPGRTPAEGATFYSAKDRSPAIECFAAPCNNGVALKLNTTAKTSFTSYATANAAAPFVDQAWLTDRVESHGAIVAATIHAGQHFPAGDEMVLDGSQVYVKLPVALGPCGKPFVPTCTGGKVPTFTRGVDRCVAFDQCVKPGACPQNVPACEDGYSLQSWKAGPTACSAFACDADFLSQ